MLVKNFFRGSSTILAYISVGLLFGGMFSCLVISSYWFSYYNPYGAHGEYTVLATYYCTLLCFLFSLLGLLVLILIFVSYFLIPKISESSALSVTLVTFLTIFSIFSIIAGLLCGVLGSAVINPNELYTPDERPYMKDFDAKCYPLLIYNLHHKMFRYVIKENDGKAYGKWLVRIARKISRDLDKVMGSKAEDELGEQINRCITLYGDKCEEKMKTFIDDLFYNAAPEYSNTLCKDVGIPSFLFAIIALIGLILFAISTCCMGNGGDASISENDA